MGPPVEISHGLPIIPGINGGSIIIPGCESVGSFDGSPQLAIELQKNGCDKPIVYVNDVLKLIPGTKVISIINAGIGTIGDKILVFPPGDTECYPTDGSASSNGFQCPIDYYGLLKTIGRPVDPPKDITFGDCDPYPILDQTKSWF